MGRPSRTAVVHHTLTSAGGGERVCLNAIEALNKVGLVPDLYLSDPLDVELIRRLYGKMPRAKVIVKCPLRSRRLGLYRKIVYKKNLKQMDEYDLVIDTSGIYIPFPNEPPKYFVYVHNPNVSKMNVEKYKSGIWRLYSKPYMKIMETSSFQFRGAKFLANSEFSKETLMKLWGRSSEVLYPPVAIRDFLYQDCFGRTGVISIGRFTPEKNHPWQLSIAQKMPELRFKICGAADTQLHQIVLDGIKRKAAEIGLSNVEFHSNLSMYELKKLLHESRYFLHTNKDEDFGITICEAIAGGCIPIVHDSGGPREIVTNRDLRFTTIQEAVNVIRKCEERYPMDPIRKTLVEHISMFSEEHFQEKLLKLIGL